VDVLGGSAEQLSPTWRGVPRGKTVGHFNRAALSQARTSGDSLWDDHQPQAIRDFPDPIKVHLASPNDGGCIHLARNGLQFLEGDVFLQAIAAGLEGFDKGIALTGGEQRQVDPTLAAFGPTGVGTVMEQPDGEPGE
jgi:hypothetical protein